MYDQYNDEEQSVVKYVDKISRDFDKLVNNTGFEKGEPSPRLTYNYGISWRNLNNLVTIYTKCLSIWI